MKNLRILVAEDNTSDFLAVKSHLESMKLEKAFIEVVRTSDGHEALSSMRQDDYDLVVLDIHLPGMEGRSIIESVRRCKPFLPIVAVSSFEGDVGEAEIINAGADDFIAKPFSKETFQARIKRALWHGSVATMDKEAAWGRVQMNLDNRTATYRQRDLCLSDYEFAILLQLVKAQGKTVDADTLERAAWGGIEKFSMRLANKIKTLRNKFEALDAPRDIIDTNRGLGYVLRSR